MSTTRHQCEARPSSGKDPKDGEGTDHVLPQALSQPGFPGQNPGADSTGYFSPKIVERSQASTRSQHAPALPPPADPDVLPPAQGLPSNQPRAYTFVTQEKPRGEKGPPTTSFHAPKQLGPYEILKALGRGGMGLVYQARDTRLNRTVALKIIRSGTDAEPEEILRFRQEAENAAKLKHPNIVAIHEVGQAENLDYFTMPYIEGVTLYEWLRVKQRSYQERATVLEKIARAMHHAHAEGIIHRDLKPDNIMLDRSDEPHLMDFGLARNIAVKSGMTLSGVALGTPGYMSPEQASGHNSKVSALSDVWGLGAVLYECLTGRAPFTGENVYQIMAAIINDDPLPPRRVDPKIPLDLETICLKCLRKTMTRRYPDAQALADDLRAWLNGDAISARKPATAEIVWRHCKKHPALSVGAVLSLLLLGGGTHFLLYRYQKDAELARLEKTRTIRENEIQLFQRNERRVKAEVHAAEGGQALALAQKLAHNNSQTDNPQYHQHLIDAEQAFLKARFADPDHEPARDGLVQAALLHFESALRENNWSQAAEKLQLASTNGHPKDLEIQAAERLEKAKTERKRFIQKRVKDLLADAAEGPNRRTPHEKAKPDLLTLGSPELVEALLPYLDSHHPEQQKLALECLMFMTGNAAPLTLAQRIAPYIKPFRPRGQENRFAIRVAALEALCHLAPVDFELYQLVRQQLAQDEESTGKQLAQACAFYLEPYLEKMNRIARDREWKVNLGRSDLLPRDRMLNEAKANWMAGQLEKAEQACNVGLELDGTYAPTYHLRAKIRIQQRKFAEAAQDLDWLAAKAPEQPAYLATYGQLYLQSYQFQEAKEKLEKALVLDPNHIEANLLMGTCLFRFVKYAEAERCFSKVLEQDPNNEEAYMQRGWTYLEWAYNKHPQALQDFQSARKINPKNPNALRFIGDLHLDNHRYELAEEAYREALNFQPKSSLILERLGRIQMYRNAHPEAFKTLQTALEADPSNLEAEYGLARCWLSLGRPDEADKLFNHLSENSLSWLVEVMRMYETFLAEARDRVGLRLEQQDEQPRSGFEWTSRGFYRLNNKRLAEAETDFKQALDLARNDPYPQLYLARIESERKHNDQAERLLNAALACNPERDWRIGLATAREILDFPKASAELLQAALALAQTLDKKSWGAAWSCRRIYALALFRNGDPDKALEALEDFQKRSKRKEERDAAAIQIKFFREALQRVKPQSVPPPKED